MQAIISVSLAKRQLLLRTNTHDQIADRQLNVTALKANNNNIYTLVLPCSDNNNTLPIICCYCGFYCCLDWLLVGVFNDARSSENFNDDKRSEQPSQTALAQQWQPRVLWPQPWQRRRGWKCACGCHIDGRKCSALCAAHIASDVGGFTLFWFEVPEFLFFYFWDFSLLSPKTTHFSHISWQPLAFTNFFSHFLALWMCFVWFCSTFLLWQKVNFFLFASSLNGFSLSLSLL